MLASDFQALLTCESTIVIGAAAISHSDNEAREIAEALVVLGGMGVLGYVCRLVEMFRNEGYPEAASRWEAIDMIMRSIKTEDPE